MENVSEVLRCMGMTKPPLSIEFHDPLMYEFQIHLNKNNY